MKFLSMLVSLLVRETREIELAPDASWALRQIRTLRGFPSEHKALNACFRRYDFAIRRKRDGVFIVIRSGQRSDRRLDPSRARAYSILPFIAYQSEPLHAAWCASRAAFERIDQCLRSEEVDLNTLVENAVFYNYAILQAELNRDAETLLIGNPATQLFQPLALAWN